MFPGGLCLQTTIAAKIISKKHLDKYVLIDFDQKGSKNPWPTFSNKGDTRGRNMQRWGRKHIHINCK